MHSWTYQSLVANAMPLVSYSQCLLIQHHALHKTQIKFPILLSFSVEKLLVEKLFQHVVLSKAMGIKHS